MLFRRRHTQARGLLVVAILGAAMGLCTAQQRPANDERLKALPLTTLQRAIDDLRATFPRRYQRGAELAERVQACAAERDRLLAAKRDPDRGARLLAEAERLQRDYVLTHPLLQQGPILFVTRFQYRSDHHNTATLFQTGEINAKKFQRPGTLKMIDIRRGGEVTTPVEASEGVVRDPEVSFDGQRVVFSMRRNGRDDYHIYELDVASRKVRRLTSAQGVSDIDPVYLPDGDIIFSSTREPKYCMCNRHIMANLFRMTGDGGNIHQIGKSTLFEGHAALLPDGRVLYDRWEYVDRNFGDAQGLWTVYPDGTHHELFWGNHTWSPGGVIDARAVPGTQQVVCIFGSCHDRPWGAMAVIDPRLGLDGRKPVARTWPPSAIELVSADRLGKSVYGFDLFKRVSPKYEDPYPLADPVTGAGAGKYFLCSRSVGRGELMGLYLVDVFGNEILLHVEEPGCYDPMLLAPHPAPPVIPPARRYDQSPGKIYVHDVYRGSATAGVQRGMVKWLRVVESPEKRFWTNPMWGGQGRISPAMNWHDFNNKRILGTVPVEADGSAYFEAPAGRFIYFQLLDADGMMVQSMRSGTIVQPGEHLGCVGCHDNSLSAPRCGAGRLARALQRPPSRLSGWHGKPRPFCYLQEVQPVWNRYCVSCHDYGKPAGQILNLAPDRTLTFNTSYNELWRKRWIAAIGAGPAQVQAPRSWGSHASKLVHVIRSGHYGVHLDDDSFDRIVTWIDINAPYYPSYASAYPANLAGRSPLDDAQLKRLTDLTGVPFAKLAGHRSNRGPQISFDRPQVSPCLSTLRDSNRQAWQEALDIIRAGSQMLAKHPRADSPDFTPCPLDQQRERKYLARQLIETYNLAAIRGGRVAYDPRPISE